MVILIKRDFFIRDIKHIYYIRRLYVVENHQLATHTCKKGNLLLRRRLPLIAEKPAFY